MPKEDILYEPIRKNLATVLASYYIEKEKKPRFQSSPFEFEDNPRLEITANGKISETLKGEFNDYTFLVLRSEGKHPDIMGFIRRKRSEPRELITVEIKNQPIKLMHIFQAHLYQEIFQSNLSFLVSPKGIPEERVRFITSPNGRFIRGKVIILQFNDNIYGKSTFECHPKLRDVVPESLRKYFELSDKK
ncbi:MAG: hypothetical protein AM326_06335 [Candidatus Thorarchaeota archaeon SMTZ-45]|nr:MAG: hypothetical protein AM326_06335 [Candidatus Thorarchaeota archaeon SMTZ-45]